MSSSPAFVDRRLTLADFTDEILVVCPRCRARATVAAPPGEAPGLLSARRLTCGSCGLQRSTQPACATLGSAGEPVDSYFGEPLWLVARHGSEILWAYNLRHLEYIESFVRATLRARHPHPSGRSNRSLVSRLPRWIKDGGNRDRVLSIIDDLKRRSRP